MLRKLKKWNKEANKQEKCLRNNWASMMGANVFKIMDCGYIRGGISGKVSEGSEIPKLSSLDSPHPCPQPHTSLPTSISSFLASSYYYYFFPLSGQSPKEIKLNFTWLTSIEKRLSQRSFIKMCTAPRNPETCHNWYSLFDGSWAPCDAP